MNTSRYHVTYYSTENFVKDAKLKQSQAWKKSNQTHPAFKRKR